MCLCAHVCDCCLQRSEEGTGSPRTVMSNYGSAAHSHSISCNPSKTQLRKNTIYPFYTQGNRGWLTDIPHKKDKAWKDTAKVSYGCAPFTAALCWCFEVSQWREKGTTEGVAERIAWKTLNFAKLVTERKVQPQVLFLKNTSLVYNNSSHKLVLTTKHTPYRYSEKHFALC